MSKTLHPNHVDLVVLCGGKGTRIASVLGTKPKCLAPYQNGTFIDYFLGFLNQFGYRRFILCIGFGSDQVQAHFQTRKPSFDIQFSVEDSPLGTGGALRNARSLVESENVTVMNGDVICKMDHRKFLEFHQTTQSFISIGLSQVESANDYGKVSLDPSGRILSFNEKSSEGESGLVNNGAYVFTREALNSLPDANPLSLETQVFPVAIKEHRCFGFKTSAELLDMGTPERYQKSQAVIETLKSLE